VKRRRQYGPARILLTALLCMGTAGWATTVIPMDVERLTAGSSHVLHGRAIESWSAWDPEGRLIHTYTRFEVMRAMKGAVRESVIVRQLGGRAGGYRQKVGGVRHFMPGEEAVLFLRPSRAADGTLVVTGLMQGNFRVQRLETGEVRVSNGAPDAQAYDPEAGVVRQYRGAHMTLDELEARVRRAIRQ
jgi:hypothetical protein